MSSKENSCQKSIIEHWYGKKKDKQYPIARYMSNKCNFDYQKCSKKRKTTNDNNKEKDNTAQSVKFSNKRKFNASTRNFRDYKYPKLFDFLKKQDKERFDLSPTFIYGNSYKSKAIDSIRLWFTNPCGIGVDPKSIKSHGSFAFLKHKSKADIISLCETNYNWKKAKNNCRLSSRVREFWRDFRISVCQNEHEELGMAQRGGCCMIAFNQISFRCTKIGKDDRKLGRWTWMQFSGRSLHRLRVITAYRPCATPSLDSKLTTVWDQQKRYINRNNLNITPRELFDNDLTELLSSWKQMHIITILAIDVNEDVRNCTFTSRLKEYNLTNIFQTIFGDTIPGSHIRGSMPILSIYAPTSLSVTQAGILEHGMGFQADHRNMFVDFDEQQFLGAPMFLIQAPNRRRLQLYDKRVVKRFAESLHRHVISNRIHSKVKFIHDHINDFSKEELSSKLNILDHQVGRAISMAEKKCRKFKDGNIPFSPTFVKHIRNKELWLSLIRRYRGLKVSNRRIRYLSDRLNIHDPWNISYEECIYQIKYACNAYKKFIPNAYTERKYFNEHLAEMNASIMNKEKSAILKRIINEESQREQNLVQRFVFKKSRFLKGVTKIQEFIQGEWVERTHPRDIERVLKESNVGKYSSTNQTPLMQPPWNKILGYTAETTDAQLILNGNFQYPSNTCQYVLRMLKQVQRSTTTTHKGNISLDDYKKVWRKTKEKRTSSKSNRHNGVYKAIIDYSEFSNSDHLLLETFHILSILPLITGIPYARHCKFISFQYFKKEGCIKADSTRSLVMGEADWNANGRILIAK